MDDNGKIILCTDLHKAIEACNIIAPEHLEVCVEDPFGVLNEIRNAGSIFLGRNVPEALGDYFAGPNHTLPTSGTARFSSPLGVDDFVKKSSFLYYTREALEKAAPRIADFAEREGLHAHARSVTIRYDKGQAACPLRRFAPAPPKGEPLAVFRNLAGNCQSLSLWERWHCKAMTERASRL